MSSQGKASGLFFSSWSSLPAIERFVDRFERVDALTRMKMKLVACELFDNALEHGGASLVPFVSIRLGSAPMARISVRYWTTRDGARRASAAVAAASAALQEKRPCLAGVVPGFPPGDHPPRRDGIGPDRPPADPRNRESGNRMRGLGLRMCASLSSSMATETGLFSLTHIVVF